MTENMFKVKLVCGDKQVVFAVTPSSLSESRSANYDQWNLVHLPTDLYAYRNTTSRNWEIQVPLVSRDVKEAAANSKLLNTVRFWLLPDFAGSGAPPPILRFSAYGDPNINNVTCILRNYSWNYPTDVDYIFPTNVQDPELKHKMPVIGTLSLSLIEIYSASEIQSRKWKIKITEGEKDDGNGPLGKTPLGGGSNPLKDSLPLLPDIPGTPDVTGDLTNFLKETTVPFITDLAKDATSSLPSLPGVPTVNGFGNSDPPFSPTEIEDNIA